MPPVSIVFAFSTVLSVTFVGVALALAAFWGFLHREKALSPASPEELNSLSAVLHESSTEFDLPDFPDFLRRVAPHMSKGFGEAEVTKLASAAEQLPHNREAQFEFQVIFHDASTPLQVRFFKDDISSIGVYFFTSKPLMELLDREMEGFFAERGI